MDARILVVDDEEIVRLSCLRVLSEAGYEVKAVPGGREAMGLLAEEAFDVVVLDIMMPELDGFTVLQAIRSEHPERDMKFIVITGLDQVSMSLRAGELGASAYIGKPFDPDELLKKVSYVLGQG